MVPAMFVKKILKELEYKKMDQCGKDIINPNGFKIRKNGVVSHGYYESQWIRVNENGLGSQGYNECRKEGMLITEKSFRKSHTDLVCSAAAHMPQLCAAIKHPEEDGNVGLLFDSD